MFSKSGLTDTWIHFFEIFWGKKYQRRNIQLFSFYIKMEKRLKTSQAVHFLIENQKLPLSMLSKSALTDVWIHFFEIFWSKKYQRRKIHLSGKIIKIEKPVKNLRKVNFSKKKILFWFFRNRKQGRKSLSLRLFWNIFGAGHISGKKYKNCQ